MKGLSSGLGSEGQWVGAGPNGAGADWGSHIAGMGASVWIWKGWRKVVAGGVAGMKLRWGAAEGQSGGTAKMVT